MLSFVCFELEVKSNSTSKVYFVGKDSDGLRGGSKIGAPSIDKVRLNLL